MVYIMEIEIILIISSNKLKKTGVSALNSSSFN